MMRKVIGTASGTGSRSFRIAEFEADGVGWECKNSTIRGVKYGRLFERGIP